MDGFRLSKRANSKFNVRAYKRQIAYAAVRVGVLVALSGCATQPVVEHAKPGFLLGLLHGSTAILALLGSLFFNIRIYAFPNSGFWYDLGFVTGFSSSIVFLILLSIARIGGFVTKEGS